jgi:hypothetical protein
MRTKSLLQALAASFVLWLVVPGFLAGCGGGGGSSGPQYALAIDEPQSSTTGFAEVTLTGDGFLPPGSTCPAPGCTGLLPAPVFGQLGAYTPGWRNEANGANLITVTMTAGGYAQSASVTITRS